MITEMKQVALLSTGKDRHAFVSSLRGLGIVHLKDFAVKPSSDDIARVENEIASAKAAAAILAFQKIGKTEKQEEPGETTVQHAIKEIMAVSVEKEDIARQIQENRAKLNMFEPWGAFDPADLDEIAKSGTTIRLYRAMRSAKRQIDALNSKVIINQDGGYVYLAVLSGESVDGQEFEEFRPPKEGFEYLETETHKLKAGLTKLEKAIASLAWLSPHIKKYLVALEKRKEFMDVLYGLTDEKDVVALEGFCPADKVADLVKLAKKEHFGYMVRMPEDPSIVPTLLNNSKIVRSINPVFKFMNTLPGYTEPDVSVWFLIFLSLFFAMIVGDAGYGLVFLLITFFAQRKAKNAPCEIFRLLYIFSGAAILWGVITGTYFGMQQIAEWPPLRALVVEKLYSFSEGNEKFMMLLCFIIGLVHISLAHIILAFRNRKTLKSLSEIGWVLMITSLFFLAANLVIGIKYPPFANWLFCIGLALIIIFTNIGKNIFKGMLLTLGDLPLKIIGGFGDIVSYLRLFAVGYAGVVMSSSFNKMALDFGASGIVAGLCAALILFAAHTLNILLSCMAVIVHGIRLNLLEFSGHLGMEWSGREYAPFKE